MNKTNINFILTVEQAEAMCEAAGKEIDSMEEYEICELLDSVISEYRKE